MFYTLYLNVYIYTHTHTHTYIYIYIYIYIYTIHTHMHIYTYTHIYMYICIYVCMCIYILYNATECRLFWGHGESGSLSRWTSDLHTARVFVRPAQLPPVSVFLYPSVNMCESPSVYMSKYVSPQKRLLICDSQLLEKLNLVFSPPENSFKYIQKALF